MIGEVLMVPVEEILSTWESVDADCDCGWQGKDAEGCGWCKDDSDERRAAWDFLLDDKRNDWQFDYVVESLRTNGFLRPNTFFERDGKRVHGDGHHRLAAAIAIGVTHLPYERRDGLHDCVAPDSGDWDGSSPIPRSNVGCDCDDSECPAA